MKKLLSILFAAVTVCTAVFVLSACSDHAQDAGLVDSQSNRIISFYNQHKDDLNIIKDTFLKGNYDVRIIEDDGSAVLTDGSSVQLEVSPVIKQIYGDGGDFDIRNMSYDSDREEFRIEAFFLENNMEIDLVYSESDLTADNNMYSSIEDNWYLFSAGMT